MIDVQVDQDFEHHLSEALERAALAAIQYVDVEGDACIILTGDEKLKELNAQYLGIEAPTDVLSFPSGEIDPDSQQLYLGDVIISLPRATIQASAAGHPVEDELSLLVVHGMLHLLGYDHAEDAEKKVMWLKQAEILQRLGCNISVPYK